MNLAYEKFMLRELLEETMDITSSLAAKRCYTWLLTPKSQDQIESGCRPGARPPGADKCCCECSEVHGKGGSPLRNSVPGRAKVILQIMDTGIGIPREKLEAIFDSFIQPGRYFDHPQGGGTGLGLRSAGTRRNAWWSSWAESAGAINQGSVFNIELPFDASKR